MGAAVPLTASANHSSRLNDVIVKAQTHFLDTAEVYRVLEHDAPALRNAGAACDRAPSKPTAGSLYLVDKNRCRSFRKDGIKWVKNTDGKTVRERHMKLKVDGKPKVNCYYAKEQQDGPRLPLARRCYWLLYPSSSQQGMVLVHYLESGDDAGSSSDGGQQQHTPHVRLPHRISPQPPSPPYSGDDTDLLHCQPGPPFFPAQQPPAAATAVDYYGAGNCYSGGNAAYAFQAQQRQQADALGMLHREDAVQQEVPTAQKWARAGTLEAAGFVQPAPGDVPAGFLEQLMMGAEVQFGGLEEDDDPLVSYFTDLHHQQQQQQQGEDQQQQQQELLAGLLSDGGGSLSDGLPDLWDLEVAGEGLRLAAAPPSTAESGQDAFASLSTPTSAIEGSLPGPLLDLEELGDLDFDLQFTIEDYEPKQDSTSGGAMVLITGELQVAPASLPGFSLRASFGGVEVPAEMLPRSGAIRCRVPPASRQDTHTVDLVLTLGGSRALSAAVPFRYVADAGATAVAWGAAQQAQQQQEQPMQGAAAGSNGGGRGGCGGAKAAADLYSLWSLGAADGAGAGLSLEGSNSPGTAMAEGAAGTGVDGWDEPWLQAVPGGAAASEGAAGPRQAAQQAGLFDAMGPLPEGFFDMEEEEELLPMPGHAAGMAVGAGAGAQLLMQRAPGAAPPAEWAVTAAPGWQPATGAGEQRDTQAGAGEALLGQRRGALGGLGVGDATSLFGATAVQRSGYGGVVQQQRAPAVASVPAAMPMAMPGTAPVPMARAAAAPQAQQALAAAPAPPPPMPAATAWLAAPAPAPAPVTALAGPRRHLMAAGPLQAAAAAPAPVALRAGRGGTVAMPVEPLMEPQQGQQEAEWEASAPSAATLPALARAAPAHLELSQPAMGFQAGAWAQALAPTPAPKAAVQKPLPPPPAPAQAVSAGAQPIPPPPVQAARQQRRQAEGQEAEQQQWQALPPPQPQPSMAAGGSQPGPSATAQAAAHPTALEEGMGPSAVAPPAPAASSALGSDRAGPQLPVAAVAFRSQAAGGSILGACLGLPLRGLMAGIGAVAAASRGFRQASMHRPSAKQLPASEAPLPEQPAAGGSQEGSRAEEGDARRSAAQDPAGAIKQQEQQQQQQQQEQQRQHTEMPSTLPAPEGTEQLSSTTTTTTIITSISSASSSPGIGLHSGPAEHAAAEEPGAGGEPGGSSKQRSLDAGAQQLAEAMGALALTVQPGSGGGKASGGGESIGAAAGVAPGSISSLKLSLAKEQKVAEACKGPEQEPEWELAEEQSEEEEEEVEVREALAKLALLSVSPSSGPEGHLLAPVQSPAVMQHSLPASEVPQPQQARQGPSQQGGMAGTLSQGGSGAVKGHRGEQRWDEEEASDAAHSTLSKGASSSS